jgi:hypothetical protein
VATIIRNLGLRQCKFFLPEITFPDATDVEFHPPVTTGHARQNVSVI